MRADCGEEEAVSGGFAPGSEWLAVRYGWRYVIQRCVFSDFLGSGYRFARYANGRVVRFWTRKKADAFAETLNKGIEE